MLYFWLIVLSFIICFLILKFIEKVFYFACILIALILIGIITIPLNPDLGVQLAAYSFGVLACLATIFLFSSFLTAVIVTPVIVLWKGLKGLFK